MKNSNLDLGKIPSSKIKSDKRILKYQNDMLLEEMEYEKYYNKIKALSRGL